MMILRFLILLSACICFLWLIGIGELGIRRYGAPELVFHNDKINVVTLNEKLYVLPRHGGAVDFLKDDIAKNPKVIEVLNYRQLLSLLTQ